MGMPKNLFLVRHGESEGNLVHKKFRETKNESFFTDEFLGLHESQYALTKRGVRQAKEAGVWFKKNGFLNFNRTIVSNNVRAMQTAAYLNLNNPLWMIDHNLRERDEGLFNVITPSKRDTGYADQQLFWNIQPFLFRPPQGESIADVCLRIKVILDTLSRECDGQDVIIVCHGHVMRAFRIVLEKFSLQKSNEYIHNKKTWTSVPNCSIIQYTRQNPKNKKSNMKEVFGWVRMIRPAGGGNIEDKFSIINRKKYSNIELLKMADINRYL